MTKDGSRESRKDTALISSRHIMKTSLHPEHKRLRSVQAHVTSSRMDVREVGAVSSRLISTDNINAMDKRIHFQ
jgi:hypothetical protein